MNSYIVKELETKAVVKELTERFDKLASMESINYLSKILLPRAQELYYKFDEYIKDNTEMKACIIEFDKTISSKANKSSL